MARPVTGARATVLAALLLVGCDINFFVCETADLEALATLPDRLSETGVDGPDVIAYVPQFELWSDGATKRRWFQLPADQPIDTSAPDSWSFPVGTRVWKEFSRDGVRIETRILSKTAPGVRGWAALSYVWNRDESEAFAEPVGRLRAGGTDHNVPAAGECAACHGGRNSWVLGLSAIQLAHDDNDSDTLELADLEARGLVSETLEPHPRVPGNPTERAALGALHANCGHCHNSDRPTRAETRCFDPKRDFDLWLTVDALESPESTPTYQTAIDGDIIDAGKPGLSELISRVNRRGFIYQMPPLGSEQIDTEMVAILRRWIASL